MVGARKREMSGVVLNYFYAVGEALVGVIAWLCGEIELNDLKVNRIAYDTNFIYRRRLGDSTVCRQRTTVDIRSLLLDYTGIDSLVIGSWRYRQSR